jgi:hypothetical protein
MSSNTGMTALTYYKYIIREHEGSPRGVPLMCR